MDSLRQLRVSTQLTQTIQDLHDETTLRLHNALQVSCTDFRPEPYSKVLQHTHCAMLRVCVVSSCNDACSSCMLLVYLSCQSLALMDSNFTTQEDTEEEAPSTRLLSKGVTCDTALLKHAYCSQNLSDTSWTYALTHLNVTCFPLRRI